MPLPGDDAVAGTRAARDVGLLIDDSGWRAYQTWLIAGTALTIVFDGVDNQLLGIAIPGIMRDWAVGRGALAPVVSLGYIGMMAGGALAGIAGDRFGRRTALLASVAVFGAMTVAAAFSRGTASLGIFRLLAGFGLGGALPNAATLAAEYAPHRHRAVAVSATIVCVPVGGTVAGLMGIQLLHAIGWRGLFIVGGAVPVFVAAILARLLPESPRYLARRPHRRNELARTLRRMGHDVDAGSIAPAVERAAARVPLRVLLERELRGDTLALWTAFFSCLLAVYLAFSWLSVLLTGAGFSSAAASAGVTAFNLGGVAGAIAGALVISRVGSRAPMLAMSAGAIAGAAGLSAMSFARGSDVAPILAMITITGGLINAVQTTMYALATNIYPGSIRATGVGSAVAIGRLGSIASGYAGAWAIGYHGSASFFALMAASMTVCLVSLAVIRHHVGRG